MAQTSTKTKRDGRASRIPAEPEAEQIAALLADKKTPPGQRRIITTLLRSLSEKTGAEVSAGPGLFGSYTEAAYSLGAANPRHAIRETLKLIAGGEAFADYKEGDRLWVWKDKRRERNSPTTKRFGEEVAARLADPQTPDNYRTALTHSLRAFCEVTGARYDESDPARSYVEAEAEAEGLGWETYNEARGNVVNLIYGLRGTRGKRQPFEEVELAAVPGVDAQNQPRRKGRATRITDDPDDSKLAGLRRRLERVKDSDDWADLCGGQRFKLEKEIQDLERRGPDDEWPDWIPG